MVKSEDLDTAIAQGIITQEQAARLRALVTAREAKRAVLLGHEERFRFMRGFNDFFFAIGVILLGFGMSYFAGGAPLGNIVAALIMWALAELLVARMRLVLPGILLAVLFVIFAYRAVPLGFWPFGSPTLDSRNQTIFSVIWDLRGSGVSVAVAAKALLAGVAAALFYIRFRLPFALLLIGSALVLAFTATTASFIPGDGTLVRAATLLFSGCVVFGIAMTFDMSDRERVTRRADCAFWLHLLAAPLIVHSLIILVTGATRLGAINGATALTIFVLVIGLAIVAILIDRRALFVSALAYLGGIIAYAISTATTSDNSIVCFSTLLILGSAVLTLGIAWMPLRRMLLKFTPSGLAERLPPLPVEALSPV